jgi:hypothetical protein
MACIVAISEGYRDTRVCTARALSKGTPQGAGEASLVEEVLPTSLFADRDDELGPEPALPPQATTTIPSRTAATTAQKGRKRVSMTAGISVLHSRRALS